jgi:hypothetical protein
MPETLVALYPILGVTGDWLDDPFDLGQLPASILPGVNIEDGKTFFSPNFLDTWNGYISKREREALERVRFAIVCRYDDDCRDETNKTAETKVRWMAACLRLIRPMPQDAAFIGGRILPDTTVQIQRFDIPVEIAVPAVQKLFRLRNRDVKRLQGVAPIFMDAMNGQCWKFRSSIELYDWGHFHHLYWKARFSLWCSAIEAIYTSNASEHKGSLVAKERIKWFLGGDTLIYEPGDIQDNQPELMTTVGGIVDDLYELRNVIAHGDKTPDKFFVIARSEYGEDVTFAGTLIEAASRIIRASLLRILEDNLLKHFVDGPASEAFFGAERLTRSALYEKQNAIKKTQ